MSTRLTADDARQSLNAHVAVKGAEIRDHYGPGFGWPELQRLLLDRRFVRYPCEITFAEVPLESGECAVAEAKGARPEDGFAIFVHPRFLARPADVVAWVLYQLVAVNYGEFASPDDAETFGAAVLGIAKDDYYAALCAMADESGSAGCGGDAG
jgi:hypothetical protein